MHRITHSLSAVQVMGATLCGVVMSLMLYATAHAGTGLATSPTGTDLGLLLVNIVTFINQTVIPFLLGVAFLVFVYGMFRYFVAGGANDAEKEKGKSLMVYAVAAFVVILIFFGVVNLLVSSIGLGGDPLENLPASNAIPITK